MTVVLSTWAGYRIVVDRERSSTDGQWGRHIVLKAGALVVASGLTGGGYAFLLRAPVPDSALGVLPGVIAIAAVQAVVYCLVTRRLDRGRWPGTAAEFVAVLRDESRRILILTGVVLVGTFALLVVLFAAYIAIIVGVTGIPPGS
jgi:hypothetical protein